nr:penicillin binding protein PbpA [Streptomyces clavuligerus]
MIAIPLAALLLVIAFVAVQLLRPLPDPVLTLRDSASSTTLGGDRISIPWPKEGQGAVTVAGSGVYETFGPEKSVPTASTAKIMTAYVLLRKHPLKRGEPGPTITVDAQTVAEGKAKDESRIEGLTEGQTFSQQDMLKMLMIPSGNNIGRLLARWSTKTDDQTAFVREMNEAAKDLGMKNTVYTDPSGLDKGTVSTAVDQLKLAEAVMEYDVFRDVVALPNAEIPGHGRIYNNNDRLILAGLGIVGIKTGSNTPAGGTLSWAAYKTFDGEDRLILGTMMAQHAPGPDINGGDSLVLVQDNSRKVVASVREMLTSANVVKKGEVVGHVDDRFGRRIPVVTTKSLDLVGLSGQKVTLTYGRKGDGALSRTARAGAVVGELTVGNGPDAHRIPLALKEGLTEPSLGTRLTRLG